MCVLQVCLAFKPNLYYALTSFIKGEFIHINCLFQNAFKSLLLVFFIIYSNV